MQSIRLTIVLLLAVLLVFPISLSAAGKNAKEHLRELADKDWRIRQKACRALGDLQTSDPSVISALAGHLKDDDSLVRYAAAKALGEKGSAAEPAIPNLIRVLDQDYVGAAASKALKHIGVQAIKPLTQVALDSRERKILRVAALAVLASFGPDAKVSVEDLNPTTPFKVEKYSNV